MDVIRRCLVLLLLVVGLLALVCRADHELKPEFQPTEHTEPSEFTSPMPPTNDGEQQQRRPGGIINFFLSPLRNGFRRARQLLGDSRATLRESADAVRLQTFKVFMRIYNKTYSPEEIPRRMALFFRRREAIEESVKMFNEGKAMFAMRENDYTDWDDDEIKKLTGVSLPPQNELDSELKENEQDSPRVRRSIGVEGDDGDDLNITVRANVPVSKDWRQSGCVAAPLNQLKCGACYAIATMGVLETMHCLKKVSSPTLSPQQVVDCSTAYRNYGCDGGWPTRVLKYLQDTKIAARETCYPFVRRQNSCQIRQVRARSGCTVAASPTDTQLSYRALNNERDILREVGTRGPVVTVMKASDKFLYYGTGIFDDPRCSRKRDDVDHAIVIVGYGRENGVDYWIIKNSWGTTSWGQGGYGKYRRGVNSCSIGHWGWVITA